MQKKATPENVREEPPRTRYARTSSYLVQNKFRFDLDAHTEHVINRQSYPPVAPLRFDRCYMMW